MGDTSAVDLGRHLALDTPGGHTTRDLAVLASATLAAVVLAAATLRRQTT